MLVDLYENSFHIYLQSDKFRIADDRFDLDVEHPMSFFISLSICGVVH